MDKVTLWRIVPVDEGYVDEQTMIATTEKIHTTLNYPGGTNQMNVEKVVIAGTTRYMMGNAAD